MSVADRRKNRIESVPIAKVVTKAKSWNPNREIPDETFTYVDLSSVDQSTKTIIDAREVLGNEAPSRARQIVETGDVLVATVRPNLNGVARVPVELNGATASTGFCVLKPNIRSLDSNYLFHWVKTPAFVADMVRKSTGANYPAVSDRIIFESKIPLPTLSEQKRIAETLDRAEVLRAKRRSALALLDELTHSIFLDMFGDPVTNPNGWDVVPFENVVYFQEGPGVRKWQFRNEGIKLVNVGNIVDGKLITENTERHLDPYEVEKKYKHFLLDAEDFVIASSGVTWGKIAEVKASHLPLCLNTSMIRIRPANESVDKQFLRSFVESPAFRRQIERLITGSAQPNFGPSHLKRVNIVLPPKDLQTDFSKRIASIEEVITVNQNAFHDMTSLIASLQHRAFRGEL